MERRKGASQGLCPNSVNMWIPSELNSLGNVKDIWHLLLLAFACTHTI